MKQIKRFKLNRSHIAVICMSLLLVLAIVGYSVISSVIAARGDGTETGGGSSGSSSVITPLEGESIYGSQNVVYPRVTTSDISAIRIDNDEGVYGFIRTQRGMPMIMWYQDGFNDEQYVPPFYESQGDISSYDDFYSVLVSDGTAQGYLLTYLSVAIGTLYFYDRIALPTVPTVTDTSTEEEKAEAARLKEEYNAMLKEFGFDKQVRVSFTYYTNEKNEDGETIEGSHSITIGGQDAAGAGYYIMVDGRDQIYYTGGAYLQYAMYGIEKFIKGSLVAPGLDQDGPYEPYLTSDFKQWKSTKFNTVGTIVDGVYVPGDKVSAESLVVAQGVAMDPKNPSKDADPISVGSYPYYEMSSFGTIDFDFHNTLKNHSDYSRFMKLLVGREVGVYYDSDVAGSDPSSAIYLSLLTPMGISDEKSIDFGDKESLTYTYKVVAIEAVITETEEITSEQRRAGADYDLIRVTYEYSIDGESASFGGGSQHAILDLSDPNLPAEAREALAEAPIGELAVEDFITFDVTYTKDNAYVGQKKLIIDAISLITDKSGNTVSKVDANSYVMFSYHEEEDGVSQGSKTWFISMEDLKTDTESVWASVGLYDVLIGQKTDSDFDHEFVISTYYYEIMRDFVCYMIYEIDYFVEYDIVSSFCFVNASERNPYYGETFYINTLNNEYKMYGLNANSCESVINFLGGVGGDGSTVSAGFSGETVAIGLTFENIEKYGLYANRIYFELPRGIFAVDDLTGEESSTGMGELSDYEWYSTLGFNLYISDVKYDSDGTAFRYIGSDMYDLVAKVSAEGFEYLDLEFTDFWARKHMLLMDISKIGSLEFDFNMTDVYGKYGFMIHTEEQYVGTKGMEIKYSSSKEYLEREGFSVAEKTISKQLIQIVPKDEGKKDIEYLNALMDTRFKEYCLERTRINQTQGKPVISTATLTDLYNKHYGYSDDHYVADSLDSVGTSNFKTAVESLFLTAYHGVLTEEEKALVLSEGSELEYLMRIGLSIEDGAKTAYYGYEFYRISDRKIMVVLYETDAAGNKIYGTTVGDFYITTFAFKQIVDQFVGLLNCVDLEADGAYPGTWE